MEAEKVDDATVIPPELPKSAGQLLDLVDLFEKPIPAVKWSVEGLISEGDIWLLSGEGGLGKTYIHIATALSLALGKPLFDHFSVSRRHNILYLDLEMARVALERRIARMLKGLNFKSSSEIPQNLFIACQGDLKLDCAVNVGLMRFIEYHKIDFVLVDSARRVISGDENDSQVTNALFRTLKQMRDILNVGFGFIVHWNKEMMADSRKANSRVRGSGDWINMSDDHFAVEASQRHHLKITPAKSRHEVALDPFHVKFDHEDVNDRNTPFRLIYSTGYTIRDSHSRILDMLALEPMTKQQIESKFNLSKKLSCQILEELLHSGKVTVLKRLPHNRYLFGLPSFSNGGSPGKLEEEG